MSTTPVERTPKRSRLRRPMALLAIGSLGIVGMGGTAGSTTNEHAFVGTYRGGEAFTIGDERCSFLGGTYLSDSVLLVFERDVGEDWTFSSRLCATISGNPLRVSAVGNFTIATSRGQLNGSFGDSFIFDTTAPLPPRVNHITGGTGDFEGATGECVQTDTVATSTGPSSNSYTGNITCDITSPK